MRAIVSGNSALIPEKTYLEYISVKARVISRVSLVSATQPWAFFCTTDTSRVPRWIILKDVVSDPETDLLIISEHVRQRLGPDVEGLREMSPSSGRVMAACLNRLSLAERRLLSRRKRRALDEMEKVVGAFLQSAVSRENQNEVDTLAALLKVLTDPGAGIQPDWEELAARWLDLIRPVWYEKLQAGRRTRPLLLKDIRNDLIGAEATLLPKTISEFTKALPSQRPTDERIVACIIGIA